MISSSGPSLSFNTSITLPPIRLIGIPLLSKFLKVLSAASMVRRVFSVTLDGSPLACSLWGIPNSWLAPHAHVASWGLPCQCLTLLTSPPLGVYSCEASFLAEEVLVVVLAEVVLDVVLDEEVHDDPDDAEGLFPVHRLETIVHFFLFTYREHS